MWRKFTRQATTGTETKKNSRNLIAEINKIYALSAMRVWISIFVYNNKYNLFCYIGVLRITITFWSYHILFGTFSLTLVVVGFITNDSLNKFWQ